MKTIWLKDEIDKLIKLYSNNRNEEIALILNKTISSIENKSFRLKLKKDKSFISNLLVKRNKSINRDLTDELLFEIALKYKSKSEFQKYDSSAYTTANKRGILDIICKHMNNIAFSIPQLILKNIMDKLLDLESMYDTRKIITPYEIDIYYTEFNLGFEYNGKLWHNYKYNKDRDLIKIKLCCEKNIELITISERSRNYELDIKNQLLENLDKISSITNKNITKESIINCKVDNIYLMIYNENDLIEIAKKYNSFKEFINLEPKIYRKLSKMGLIDNATSHMNDRLRKRNIIEVMEVIKKYKALGDLIKNDRGTYLYIKKNKLEYLITHLKSRFNKQ